MTPLDAAFADLASLYDALDLRIRRMGLVCQGCGQCCHFDTAPYVLYGSTLEAAYLVAHTGPPAAQGRALRCPYQKAEACTARSSRPLGCRLHFCEVPPAVLSRLDDLSADAHARLKALHERFDVPWNYRPLLAALADSPPPAAAPPARPCGDRAS